MEFPVKRLKKPSQHYNHHDRPDFDTDAATPTGTKRHETQFTFDQRKLLRDSISFEVTLWFVYQWIFPYFGAPAYSWTPYMNVATCPKPIYTFLIYVSYQIIGGSTGYMFDFIFFLCVCVEYSDAS